MHLSILKESIIKNKSMKKKENKGRKWKPAFWIGMATSLLWDELESCPSDTNMILLLLFSWEFMVSWSKLWWVLIFIENPEFESENLEDEGEGKEKKGL